MSLIIPWGDIHEGRIASARDYDFIVQEVLRTVGSHRDLFKGAAFFGSITRGDLRPGVSDLDLIMVARGDPRRPEVSSLVRALCTEASARCVALDVTLLSSHDAYFSPSYGPSYRQILKRCSPEYSAGERQLHECFRVPPGSVAVEMEVKMASKLRSVRARYGHFRTTRWELEQGRDRAVEAWIQSSWDRVVRPLREHITIARRLLWWMHGDLMNDGKHAVIEAFLDEDTFGDFHNDFTDLMELDHQYEQCLQEARAGNRRRVLYLRKVGRLLQRNFGISTRLLSEVVSFMHGFQQGAA